MRDLVRNRVTEKDIREWLDRNGYYGLTANLDSVELFAIKRPGWEQLFRFHGKVRVRGVDDESHVERILVWGVVVDDERRPKGQRTVVTLCNSEEEQEQQLSLLSEGMLKATRNQDRVAGGWPLLLIGLSFVAVFIIVAIAKRYL